MDQNKIIMENDWCEDTSFLIKKWDRICLKRKHMHNRAANSFGWKNKLLSIPIILISTIMGSLSFIHPSFLDECQTNNSRLLLERNLQTIEPSPPPTQECYWEKYEGDLITEAPFCDNSIIKHNNNYYKSTLSDVDELVCDRDVNYVGETAYNQIPVAGGITTQSEAEAWCVEHDEGHGIFYQKWVDGQIICMVLAEAPNNIILHAEHLFGGVCLSHGLLNNPTQTYINNCGNQLTIDVDGNCANIPECALSCPGILGGHDLQTSGFSDCECCYNYWTECSWAECSDTMYNYYYASEVPTSSPTYDPTYIPVNYPTTTPTYQPTPAPTPQPPPAPTPQPPPAPTPQPPPAPTHHPTNHPTYAESSSTDIHTSISFTYIIGGFNMFIAILSALHTFLKYDALEDRHRQYSRHFGALQLDLEALMAKPAGQRGNASTMIERYKTKYAVLINNAPDLSDHLERICCQIGTENIRTIELT
jgi:hypothetical protein